MNIITKKAYLEAYLIQQTKITRLQSLMHVNPKSSDRYIRQIEKSELLREKIENDVDAVDGGILSEVLAQKYLCGKTLEEIALMLDYSKRQIERFHSRALDMLNIS